MRQNCRSDGVDMIVCCDRCGKAIGDPVEDEDFNRKHNISVMPDISSGIYASYEQALLCDECYEYREKMFKAPYDELRKKEAEWLNINGLKFGLPF